MTMTEEASQKGKQSDDDRMTEMEQLCAQTIDMLRDNLEDLNDDDAFYLLKSIYDLGRKHRNEE